MSITFDKLCEVIDMTADTMDNYMYVTDFQNDCYHISKNALERFPIPSATFNNVAKTHELFVYEEDLPAIKAELKDLASSDRQSHNMQYRWISKAGNPVWINCRGYVHHEKGKAVYMVGCINEIGERQKADNTTGLLKLSSAIDIQNDLATGEFNGFVLRIGIDDMRGINARMGVDGGNYVIAQTAECIQAELTENQYVYHIDGDEFMVVSVNQESSDDARNLFKRIRQHVDDNIARNGFKAVYSISAGIVCGDELKGKAIDFVFKASEYALSLAKEKGKNTSAEFDSDAYERALSERELERLLRDAIDNNFAGFSVNYQILYSKEKGIIGVESLMRYTRPDGTMVSPAEFIPILEQSGLIIPAGRWILKESLKNCKNVQKIAPEFFVTVNVSYIQVSKTNLAEDVAATLRATGVKPSSLVIELTESGFLESDLHYTKTWKHLKNMGVRMALDDFGTGYSNFHYLNELKPDIVKIDRSFTVSALKDKYEFQLLLNMRNLAKGLSLNMCIEGIETEEDLSKMAEVHPEYYQGFYFGRPVPIEELIEKMQQQ